MSAGIRATDSNVDRLSKVLPADVTAAFLSLATAAKALGEDASLRLDVIAIGYVAIAVISPFYFRFAMNVKNPLQNGFLTVSFLIFGLAIAQTEFADWLSDSKSRNTLQAFAIILPGLWAFLVAPIFARVFGEQMSSSASQPLSAAEMAPIDPGLAGNAIPLNPQ